MYLFDDLHSRSQSIIDTSLLELFASSGAIASAQLKNGCLSSVGDISFWQKLGLSESEARASHIDQWMESQYFSKLSNTLAQVEESDQPQTVVIEFCNHDAKATRECHLLIVPDRDKNTFLLYAIPTEKTKEPLHNNQKIRLQGLGQLTATVAHDLNNIFSGMLSILDLLHEETTPATQDRLDQLETAIGRANDLTDGILEFLKGSPTPTKAIDPTLTLEDIGQLIAETLGEQITFNMDLPEEGHNTVLINPSSLGQIFLNLIINARDALDGSGEINVKAEYHPIDDPQEFILSVSDSGEGISQEEQKRMFEPFFTTKGKSQGTGLGLTIIKTLVEEASGTIDVTSSIGEGSCFQVFLPIHHKEQRGKGFSTN